MNHGERHQDGVEQGVIEELVDIEEYAKAGRRPPRARKYRIRVDRDAFVVEVPSMTGREILLLAGKNPPERWKLFQKLHQGGVKPVGLEERVDFTTPGVERFVTLVCDQTDGEATQRDFSMPEDDESFLRATGLGFDLRAAGGTRVVILLARPVPHGYEPERVDTALLLPPGYPDVQIDMVYFRPALRRTDGKGLVSVADQPLVDGVWQRWSRHRTPQSPWRPGVDSLATHLALVDEWLTRELGR